MKIIHQEKNQYVLRLERGEEVIQALKNFAKEEAVKGAFFFGLGAVEQVRLAYFDRNLKQYSIRYFPEPHELASIIGNIAQDQEGQLIIHAHGTLGKPTLEAFAGHIQKAVVAVTLEIIFILLQNESGLTRQLDPGTGLKLLT